jgi:endonuclease/exonuclease/phosphatase (EEP) superfamily protein YafD
MGRGRVPRSRRRRRHSRLGRLRRWLGASVRAPHDVLGSRRSVLARAAALLAWAYLGTVCLLAAVIWTLGDSWWPATVLLFLGRWIFLLPLALLVPAALLVRRAPLLVPLLLAALVVLGPVMGFRTGWRRWLPSAGGSHVRVVTLNVDGGELLVAQLPFLVKDWSADVVALQECGPALAAAARTLPGWNEHDEGELCLLSRFPIREARAMDRSALERVKEGTAGIGGAGYVVRYALETPRGVVGFTNLHLETPRKGFEALFGGSDWFDVDRLRANTILRDVESDLAARWVSQGRTPLLVAGDFNTPVESRIFRHRWGWLDDAFSRAGAGFGMTKYNGWIRVRIDHVLTGRGWHADRAVVGPDVGSDHRPLIVDLTLEARR